VSDDEGVSVVNVHVQGQSRHVLQLTDFLDLVGRHDLTVELETVQRRHLIVALGGGVAFAAGKGVGMWLIFSSVEQQSQAEGCCVTATCFSQTDHQQQVGVDWGVAIVLTGAAAMVAGILYGVSGSSPVSIDEEKQMAKEYNQRLRRSLGLPDEPDEAPVRAPASRGRSFSVEPILVAGGGGVGFRGTFWRLNGCERQHVQTSLAALGTPYGVTAAACCC
jgi:hypothetical protein